MVLLGMRRALCIPRCACHPKPRWLRNGGKSTVTAAAISPSLCCCKARRFPHLPGCSIIVVVWLAGQPLGDAGHAVPGTLMLFDFCERLGGFSLVLYTIVGLSKVQDGGGLSLSLACIFFRLKFLLGG